MSATRRCLVSLGASPLLDLSPYRRTDVAEERKHRPAIKFEPGRRDSLVAALNENARRLKSRRIVMLNSGIISETASVSPQKRGTNGRPLETKARRDRRSLTV